MTDFENLSIADLFAIRDYCNKLYDRGNDTDGGVDILHLWRKVDKELARRLILLSKIEL